MRLLRGVIATKSLLTKKSVTGLQSNIPPIPELLLSRHFCYNNFTAEAA